MKNTKCSCQNEFQVAADAEALVQEAASQLRPHFRREQAHEHAVDYLRGLLADVERKNGWQLAEHAGYDHPRGMQRVLDRYSWDHRAAREDLRSPTIPTEMAGVTQARGINATRSSLAPLPLLSGTHGAPFVVMDW